MKNFEVKHIPFDYDAETLYQEYQTLENNFIGGNFFQSDKRIYLVSRDGKQTSSVTHSTNNHLLQATEYLQQVPYTKTLLTCLETTLNTAVADVYFQKVSKSIRLEHIKTNSAYARDKISVYFPVDITPEVKIYDKTNVAVLNTQGFTVVDLDKKYMIVNTGGSDRLCLVVDIYFNPDVQDILSDSNFQKKEGDYFSYDLPGEKVLKFDDVCNTFVTVMNSPTASFSLHRGASIIGKEKSETFDAIHIKGLSAFLAANDKIVFGFYDSNANKLNVEKVWQLAPSDIHEIHNHENNIYYVNTAKNRVSVLNTELDSVTDHYVYSDKQEDVTHLNGFFMQGHDLVLVSGLNEDVEKHWRYNLNAGFILDLENSVFHSGLKIPHSPRVYGNYIYFVESSTGLFSRIDRNTGNRYDLLRLPGFLRGLDIYNGFALIGSSAMRGDSAFWNFASPRLLRTNKSRVFCVNLETLEYNHVELKDDGEIRDLGIVKF